MKLLHCIHRLIALQTYTERESATKSGFAVGFSVGYLKVINFFPLHFFPFLQVTTEIVEVGCFYEMGIGS